MRRRRVAYALDEGGEKVQWIKEFPFRDLKIDGK